MSEHQPARASVASTSYPQGLLKDVQGVSLEVSWHVSTSFQHGIQGSFLLCEGESYIEERPESSQEIKVADAFWTLCLLALGLVKQLDLFALSGEKMQWHSPVKGTAVSSLPRSQERE